MEWKHGGTVPWEGTGMTLEVFHGRFGDDADRLGGGFDGVAPSIIAAVPMRRNWPVKITPS